MADKCATDLDLLKFHIKEECSPTNIKVEDIDEEISTTEIEASDGSSIYQNVDINEQLVKEKWNLENSEEQLLNENAILDPDLLKFHVKEECSPINIKVEEIDEEIVKTETETSGGLWVYQNVNTNELLVNEKQYLEHCEEQLLNENAGVKKETFQDDLNIWERINNLSTNCQKENENRLGSGNENMNFDAEETVSQQHLIANVKINNKEENIQFLHNNNDDLSTVTQKKRVLVSKCEKDDLNHAKGKKQMSDHNNYKATEKRHKCNECFYTAARKSSLQSHIISHHTMEKPYKCNECSYAAAYKSSLVSHIKYRHTTEKAYKCNECSYTAVIKSILLSHIRSHHTMEKPYKCNECSYAAVTKSNLVSHIKVHHTKGKSYKCSECSYAAVSKSCLASHIKSHHTMEKPHKCNECSYATVSKSGLVTHINSCHTMEKPYKCNECSYAAAHKSNLLSHIKFHHTMDKPYNCNECAYAAVQKCDLLRHIQSHQVVKKSYKCNECSYAAGSKSNLLSHIKSRHTME